MPELCLQITNVSDVQIVCPELVNPILALWVTGTAHPKLDPHSCTGVPMCLMYVIAFEARTIETILRTSKDRSEDDVDSANPAVTATI